MDTICGAVITGVVVPNRVWTQFVGQLLLEWWSMDTICGAVITGVVPMEWWFLHNLWGSYYVITGVVVPNRVWTQFVGQLLLEWWFLIEYGHNLWGSYYWSGGS